MDVSHVDAINRVYLSLREHYGVQPWWPADDPFEVMIGAILTQNTAWTNVEKALTQLKQHDMCNADSLAVITHRQLAPLIRSSGYYNQKAQRLIDFSRWYVDQGGFEALKLWSLVRLREALLAIKGIGDETADDMVLYAFEQPSFVVDAYTRRIFSRLAILDEKAKYAQLQQAFHNALDKDVDLFKQYHALIVSHAKQHCQKTPSCSACPLFKDCRYEA